LLRQLAQRPVIAAIRWSGSLTLRALPEAGVESASVQIAKMLGAVV